MGHGQGPACPCLGLLTQPGSEADGQQEHRLSVNSNHGWMREGARQPGKARRNANSAGVADRHSGSVLIVRVYALGSIDPA
jgi:hypothetical protein